MFGYQIGLNNDNLYVAVPAKYFANGQSVSIQVFDGNKVEISKVVIDTDRESEATFKDKFKPENNYKLYYFKIKEY